MLMILVSTYLCNTSTVFIGTLVGHNTTLKRQSDCVNYIVTANNTE